MQCKNCCNCAAILDSYTDAASNFLSYIAAAKICFSAKTLAVLDVLFDVDLETTADFVIGPNIGGVIACAVWAFNFCRFVVVINFTTNFVSGFCFVLSYSV